MIADAFCSMSFASGAALSGQHLGRRLLVDGVCNRFGLVLRAAQFVEQRFCLFPIRLVLLDGPLSRKAIHLGAVARDVFPQQCALCFECVITGDQPAAQRGERGVNPRHHIAGRHRRWNAKVDRPVGGGR
jgi:hypothetical protein